MAFATVTSHDHAVTATADTIRKLQPFTRPLVISDAVMKLLGACLLSPIVGLLFRVFLWMSGRTVVADTDIAALLINPLSWPCLVAIAAVAIAVGVFGQTVLNVLIIDTLHLKRFDFLASLWRVTVRWRGLVRIGAEITIRLLLLALPLLTGLGVTYVALLGKYDINFYLAEHPPEFLAAIGIAGLCVCVYVVLALKRSLAWLLAAILHVYDNVPASRCLEQSRLRMDGDRLKIGLQICGWLGLSVVCSAIGSFVITSVAGAIIPRIATSLWAVVIILGLCLLAWNLFHFAMTVASSLMLAAITATVYLRTISEPLATIESDDELAVMNRLRIRWSRPRMLAAIVLLGCVSAGVGIATIESARSDNDVEVTGHRGAAGPFPENSLLAVEQAIADGADWVEIDVQETTDGEVVVIHDSDFKKVASDPRKVWMLSAADVAEIQLRATDGESDVYADVPTLADVLTACQGRAGVTIELKYYGHNDQLEARVIDLVESHEMTDHVVLMSLKAEGIRKVRQLRPGWTVGLLTAVAAGDLTKADVDFLAVSTKLATREFIRRAHRRGKRVHVWTVNDAVAMSTMISRGADNLITDHPALARAVLDEREQMGYIERALIDLAYRFGMTPTSASTEKSP